MTFKKHTNPQKQERLSGRQSTTKSQLDHREESLNERISTLELKVAYHERLNEELSDQVYQLHRELDVLRKTVITLKQSLERQDDQGINIGPADEAPPHY